MADYRTPKRENKYRSLTSSPANYSKSLDKAHRMLKKSTAVMLKRFNH